MSSRIDADGNIVSAPSKTQLNPLLNRLPGTHRNTEGLESGSNNNDDDDTGAGDDDDPAASSNNNNPSKHSSSSSSHRSRRMTVVSGEAAQRNAPADLLKFYVPEQPASANANSGAFAGRRSSPGAGPQSSKIQENTKPPQDQRQQFPHLNHRKNEPRYGNAFVF